MDADRRRLRAACPYRLVTKDGPFDLDLIFAPDGIEQFEEAWQQRVGVDGFPVRHPDDIIANKQTAWRAKDRALLPRLITFPDEWKSKLA